VARAPSSISSPIPDGPQLLDNTWYFNSYSPSIQLTHFVVATSVDVERLFSRGRLILSHVCSCLTAQSTRALLCLGYWSRLNLVKTEDILKVSSLADVEGTDEQELEDGWDKIVS